MTDRDNSHAVEVPHTEFLCVTMYTENIGPIRNFYHEVIGLPIDYEVPGHIAAMPKICAHDPSEGTVGSLRLYFLCDDVAGLALAAAKRGSQGILRTDGFGKPAWESTDPFGNSVVVLTRQQKAGSPQMPGPG